MPLKILLADDNMTAQNTGRRILSEAGYTVVAVSNGAAALKKFASEHPDLLVLDVFMPGYSGLEVCEKLKADASVPVLLTYSRMEPFRAEDGERVRADASIAKPFDSAELLAAIEKLINANGKIESSSAAESVTAAGSAGEAPASESTAPSAGDQQPAHPEKPVPAPFVEFGSKPGKSSVAFESAVAETLNKTEGDAAESGFFAFRSNSMFTASSLDQVGSSTAKAPSAPAEKPANKKGFSESFFGSDVAASAPESPSAATASQATEPNLETFDVAQPTTESAPEPNNAEPARAAEGWWNAQPADAVAAEPGIALHSAGESAPQVADLSPASPDMQSSEADQPADFHSVLAQLLPSVPAAMPPMQAAEPELSAVESLASEAEPEVEAEPEMEVQPDLSPSWPSPSLETALREAEQAAGANSNGSAHDLEPASDLQAQWNSSLVSSMCELNELDQSSEPSVALEPVVTQPKLESDSGNEEPSSEVTNAVERVLARLRKSLLSEVMRELSPK